MKKLVKFSTLVVCLTLFTFSLVNAQNVVRNNTNCSFTLSISYGSVATCTAVGSVNMVVPAMSQLAINATEWRSARWAKDNGLYAEIFESAEEMDTRIDELALKLSKSNPEAMMLLKKIFWEGTENWDQLLSERAAMSGKLVLSDFTRNAINAFKKK